MKEYYLQQHSKHLNLDTTTAIGVYLKLRNTFPHLCLFEHSTPTEKTSILAFDPIASFELKDQTAYVKLPDDTMQVTSDTKYQGIQALEQFCDQFTYVNNEDSDPSLQGVYGFMSYDLVEQLENISISDKEPEESALPLLSYKLFRYQVIIDHQKNKAQLFESCLKGQKTLGSEVIEQILNETLAPSHPFHLMNGESCDINSASFLEIVKKGKEHCLNGDVFQIVLSRKFSQSFIGDDFNVYRALRTVSPSPYLFHFDFGDFKIFGASPESQLIIKNQRASLHPIAGTFRSTGKPEKDNELAEQLREDPKESAEHTMLVDLARNDLSVYGGQVTVETFKEVQHFSHVIHMVSEVSAQIQSSPSSEVVASTFPAGTLSGAPKVRAMQLINKYEKSRREAYGGAIGYLGFNGDFNHAIIIRSFVSKNRTLYYQAGAGIVADSKPESELQEVNNKLAALKQALKAATLIS